MTEADYQIEPPYSEKFKTTRVKDIITSVLKSRLAGVSYHADNTSTWAREIADEVKAKLKEENWPRYKYVVQVFIGEHRGEGIRLASKCFWDTRTDHSAHDSFANESVFCVAAVYGIYLY